MKFSLKLPYKIAYKSKGYPLNTPDVNRDWPRISLKNTVGVMLILGGILGGVISHERGSTADWDPESFYSRLKSGEVSQQELIEFIGDPVKVYMLEVMLENTLNVNETISVRYADGAPFKISTINGEASTLIIGDRSKEREERYLNNGEPLKIVDRITQNSYKDVNSLTESPTSLFLNINESHEFTNEQQKDFNDFLRRAAAIEELLRLITNDEMGVIDLEMKAPISNEVFCYSSQNANFLLSGEEIIPSDEYLYLEVASLNPEYPAGAPSFTISLYEGMGPRDISVHLIQGFHDPSVREFERLEAGEPEINNVLDRLFEDAKRELFDACSIPFRDES